MRSSDEARELADLLAPYWSAPRAAEALGLTPGALGERLAEGSVLAVAIPSGTLFFPIWQFRRMPDGRVEVKPGLLDFIKTLHTVMKDGWTVGTQVRTPAPELDDLTPEQWVDSGREPAVLDRYADALVQEWERG